MHPCILCNELETRLFHKNSLYTYLECLHCGLVFVNPEERLSADEEMKQYNHHQNDPQDEGYRHFLNGLFEPVNRLLKPGSYGLDYGSGPGPTLHLMFEESGHKMEIFDPYYADHPDVLNKKYDFITCTETAEHFYNPAEEFAKLWNILKPGGILGIMTLLLSKPEVFANWHYARDETHVAFYREETFRWLAAHLDAAFTRAGQRIILLKKKSN